jgi:hypothetical protein
MSSLGDETRERRATVDAGRAHATGVDPAAGPNIEAVPPSQAVVERVAAREGVDHTDLTPLFEAIDPDALDALVTTSGPKQTPVHVTFRYQGYDVRIAGGGSVTVTPVLTPDT